MTFDPQWPWYSPPRPTPRSASRPASSSSPLPSPALPPGAALARALGVKGGELPNGIADAAPVVVMADYSRYSPSYEAEKLGTRAFTGAQFTTVALAGAAVVLLFTTPAVSLGLPGGIARSFVLEDLSLSCSAPAAMVGTLWSVLRSAPGVVPALPAQLQVPTVQDVGGDQPPRVTLTTGVAASVGPVSWIESGTYRGLEWYVPADRFLLIRSVSTNNAAITYRVWATWRELPTVDQAIA